MSAVEQPQGGWRIKVAAGEFGPVDLATVQAWVREGRVTPNDFVFNPASNSWVAAGSVPELTGFFPLSTAQAAVRPASAKKKRPVRIIVTIVVIVVVVIIVRAACVAILGPAFVRAREAARRTACINNLKQIGLALRAYAEDFGHRYPWKVARRNPDDAWRDLGLLYPSYVTAIGAFICPSSRDEDFVPMSSSGPKKDRPFNPFRDNPRERTSYGYSYARTRQRVLSWGDRSLAGIRLLADKKAGYDIAEDSRNPPTKANHAADGRNVLYQSGNGEWQPGFEALDPEPNDDRIGRPNAENYADWWSDPPFYGE